MEPKKSKFPEPNCSRGPNASRLITSGAQPRDLGYRQKSAGFAQRPKGLSYAVCPRVGAVERQHIGRSPPWAPPWKQRTSVKASGSNPDAGRRGSRPETGLTSNLRNMNLADAVLELPGNLQPETAEFSTKTTTPRIRRAPCRPSVVCKEVIDLKFSGDSGMGIGDHSKVAC